MPPCDFHTTHLLYMFTSYTHVCVLFFKSLSVFAPRTSVHCSRAAVSPTGTHDLDLCSPCSFPLHGPLCHQALLPVNPLHACKSSASSASSRKPSLTTLARTIVSLEPKDLSSRCHVSDEGGARACYFCHLPAISPELLSPSDSTSHTAAHSRSQSLCSLAKLSAPGLQDCGYKRNLA